jgi:Fe2+ transport system protein FeoA
MSPLAFLQEGETAEIIDPHVNRSLANHPGRHRHQHGRGGFLCASACNECSCRQSLSATNFSHSQIHLQNMGLRPGKQVEMITNRGSGPLVLRVDECRIAIGRGAAMKIYVRRNTP